MHGLDVFATMRRVAPLAAKLRLSTDLDNYAEDYSRGMKKKLGLLLAVLHEPKLLVLDEPNGLDVEATHLFYDLIFETANQGTTVLFSTHLMDHVTKLCSTRSSSTKERSSRKVHSMSFAPRSGKLAWKKSS
jgi:ABC-2 type transport system ATP-binding protein